MRLRLPIALSAAALVAVLVTGCSTGSPSAAESGAPSGKAVEAVKVEGKLNEEPKVTFKTPLEVKSPESKIVVEGDGDKIKDGDLLDLSLVMYDADSGKRVVGQGFGKDDSLPTPYQKESVLANVLGQAKIGSRIAFVMPPSGQSKAGVFVADITGTTPKSAWGKGEKPVEGMPKVTLDKSGAPTIEIPKNDAPTETKVVDLKKGDGKTVGAGDTVLVQYKGVKWSDGKEFDSTWSRGGVPTSFQTTGVVPGFKAALEGQKVGSQVLVVMPPKDGYGEKGDAAGGQGHELAGESLVFVVDILGSVKTPEAPAGSGK